MVANQGSLVEAVMELGPLTVRPSERLDRFAQRLERASVLYAAVTTPEGRLWGLLSRAEAESSLRDWERDQPDAAEPKP
jgi:Mg/Co/Ni transporter MgtE